jgi:hypothetical protein
LSAKSSRNFIQELIAAWRLRLKEGNTKSEERVQMPQRSLRNKSVGPSIFTAKVC